MKSSSHFQGQSVVNHLKGARKKGASASSEIHGTELSGSWNGALDASREALLFFFLILSLHPPSLWLLFTLGLTLSLWKGGRSAALGFSRLERLHRLLEEEKKEIETHPQEEREELKAIYQAKGFAPPLLDQVISVLMSDDNRLLQEMLEEELGVRLGELEHPLKQALFAFLGSGMTWGILIGSNLFGFPILLLSACVLYALNIWIFTRKLKNHFLPSFVWHFALLTLVLGSLYLLEKWIG